MASGDIRWRPAASDDVRRHSLASGGVQNNPAQHRRGVDGGEISLDAFRDLHISYLTCLPICPDPVRSPDRAPDPRPGPTPNRVSLWTEPDIAQSEARRAGLSRLGSSINTETGR